MGGKWRTRRKLTQRTCKLQVEMFPVQTRDLQHYSVRHFGTKHHLFKWKALDYILKNPNISSQNLKQGNCHDWGSRLWPRSDLVWLHSSSSGRFSFLRSLLPMGWWLFPKKNSRKSRTNLPTFPSADSSSEQSLWWYATPFLLGTTSDKWTMFAQFSL